MVGSIVLLIITAIEQAASGQPVSQGRQLRSSVVNRRRDEDDVIPWSDEALATVQSPSAEPIRNGAQPISGAGTEGATDPALQWLTAPDATLSGWTGALPREEEAMAGFSGGTPGMEPAAPETAFGQATAAETPGLLPREEVAVASLGAGGDPPAAAPRIDGFDHARGGAGAAQPEVASLDRFAPGGAAGQGQDAFAAAGTEGGAGRAGDAFGAPGTGGGVNSAFAADSASGKPADVFGQLPREVPAETPVAGSLPREAMPEVAASDRVELVEPGPEPAVPVDTGPAQAVLPISLAATPPVPGQAAAETPTVILDRSELFQRLRTRSMARAEATERRCAECGSAVLEWASACGTCGRAELGTVVPPDDSPEAKAG
ncbi:MAG: hypothetical protein U0821_00175 [Chloroflexota bacterium]